MLSKRSHIAHASVTPQDKDTNRGRPLVRALYCRPNRLSEWLRCGDGCFFGDEVENGAGEVVWALDSYFLQGWRGADEIGEGLVEPCGAPGGRPSPHGGVSVLLYEPEGEGVAEGGGEAAPDGGFVACEGVAVGPCDRYSWVVWVGVVVGLYGGGHGLLGVDGVLVAGVYFGNWLIGDWGLGWLRAWDCWLVYWLDKWDNYGEFVVGRRRGVVFDLFARLRQGFGG